MAKWTLPEGKIYTQADLDAAIAAVLTEAADVAWRFYAKGQVTKPSDIKALIPDAGAALDRALAAQREKDAKVAEAAAEWADARTAVVMNEGKTWDRLANAESALAAAIRHGSAISAQGEKT